MSPMSDQEYRDRLDEFFRQASTEEPVAMEDPLRSAQVTTSQPADDFPPADLTKIDDGTPTARPKQRIARIDGKMVVYHERAWWPAIFHRDLKAEKIAEAPPGMYAHMPACGRDELDVTSYWPDHHDWGFSRRTDRPDVLFEFFAREKQSVSYPGVMFSQGKIVVDEDEIPIVNWPIPFCLSSQVEGARLEAMSRENGNRITKDDFKARMPPDYLSRYGERKAVAKAGALGMRRQRFRDQAGLVAFEFKQGGDSRKRAIVQCIPPADMAKVLLTNSTRHVPDLSIEARAYVGCTNRGTEPQKAGKNRVTEEQRKTQYAKKNKVFQGFEPPNPAAWPYGDNIMDDKRAIANARASSREMLPIGSHDIIPSIPRRELKRSLDDREAGTMDNSRDTFKRQKFERHQGHNLVSYQFPGEDGSSHTFGEAEQSFGALDMKAAGKRGRGVESSAIHDSQSLQQISIPKPRKIQRPRIPKGFKRHEVLEYTEHRPAVGISNHKDLQTLIPWSSQQPDIRTPGWDHVQASASASGRHIDYESQQYAFDHVQSNRSPGAAPVLNFQEPETRNTMRTLAEACKRDTFRWYKAMKEPRISEGSMQSPRSMGQGPSSPASLSSSTDLPSSYDLHPMGAPQKSIQSLGGRQAAAHSTYDILATAGGFPVVKASTRGDYIAPATNSEEQNEQNDIEAEIAQFLAEHQSFAGTD
ncbi:MAG: hypothetical protein Q9202_000577 [Teloschistes flavicans]